MAPVRRRPAITQKVLREWLESTTTQLWGAAQQVERDSIRVMRAADTLERLMKKANAQAVLDGLAPDVEALVDLLQNSTVRTSEVKLRELVSRIADRMGID